MTREHAYFRRRTQLPPPLYHPFQFRCSPPSHQSRRRREKPKAAAARDQSGFLCNRQSEVPQTPPIYAGFFLDDFPPIQLNWSCRFLSFFGILA